jgi:hypothetical protein
MMILNYDDFLTEKLGISNDVIFLVDFILDKIKDKKSLIIDNIPDETTFKINKIIIKFTENNNYLGSFDYNRSKLTKNGFDIYLNLNKETDLKSSLYHELTHVVKFQNLSNKKLKMISPNNFYHDPRFENLLYLLYCSDESEINAKVAEIYSKIEDEMTYSNTLYKKNVFNYYCNLFKPNNLITYDIYDDLKNISNKDKIKFFKHILNIKFIRKNSKNRISFIFNLIKYIFNNKEKINLDSVMLKTQKYINNQGKKLSKKIDKLFDLL